MTKNHDFYTIFSKELDECKQEFERHLPTKGVSWQREGPRWMFAQVQIAFEDLQNKNSANAVVAREDQAIDLINLLLMFIQQSREERTRGA